MVFDTSLSDREFQRLRALASVFSKTNRILTGDRELVVKMENSRDKGGLLGHVPAYSLYPNIVIHYNHFQDFHKPKTLIQLLGGNYHELSHILFTPRKFKTQFVPANAQMAWAVLEDQRIESLFTALYEPAGKYFTEMVIRFIVDDEEGWPVSFLWTYGRSYLPLEIREELEARFVLSTRSKNIAKRLINEFKGFTNEDFKYRATEVVNVVTRFQKILNQAKKENGDTGEPQQCGDADPGNAGNVDVPKEKEASEEDKRRREVEEETGEDQSGFWEESDEDDEDVDESEEDSEVSGGDGEIGEDEEGSEGAGGGSGEDSEEDGVDSDSEYGSDSESDDDSDDGEGDGGDGASDENDDDGDSEVDLDEESEGEESSGASGGSKSGHSRGEFEDDELKDYLKDVVEAVEEDTEVKNEVTRINTAMNDSGNIDLIDFGNAPHIENEIMEEDAADLKKITEHFQRLYANVEPGWKYGSDVGKLNVGRAMLDPENYDEHFDEWDEGREQESGLEVFISADLSGSMEGQEIEEASRALWKIKRALDEVGAKTTVVGFHAITLGLYDRNQEAPKNHVPRWTALGGATLPAESFHMARRVLTNSPMPNKLFIVITDGGWGNTYQHIGSFRGQQNSGSRVLEGADLADLIARIPGTRMYVGVGGAGMRNESFRHLFNSYTSLSNPNALVNLVNRTVTAMLDEIRR